MITEPENPRAGYLRFACKVCGAIIKKPVHNPRLYLLRVVANNGEGRFVEHECDDRQMGLAVLLGCTFDNEAKS